MEKADIEDLIKNTDNVMEKLIKTVLENLRQSLISSIKPVDNSKEAQALYRFLTHKYKTMSDEELTKLQSEMINTVAWKMAHPTEKTPEYYQQCVENSWREDIETTKQETPLTDLFLKTMGGQDEEK